MQTDGRSPYVRLLRAMHIRAGEPDTLTQTTMGLRGVAYGLLFAILLWAMIIGVVLSFVHY